MKLNLKPILTLVFFTLFLSSCGDTDKTNNAQKNKKSSVVSSNPAKSNTKTSFDLGVDYEELKKAYDTENKEQVVIYEFFNYACPHCYTFEPFIDTLLDGQPDYVKLIRVPLGFQQGWGTYQQAYLTSEVMGISEKSHRKLFEAIHEDHKRFNSIDELAQWYEDEMDVKKEEFLSTADSFIIDSKQRVSDKMGLMMEISSTPTLIVNGKYRVSKNIKKRDGIIKIVKHLIEKEAKAMKLIAE